MNDLDKIVSNIKDCIINEYNIQLKTSGTTSSPKIIEKDAKQLFNNSKNISYNAEDIFGFLYNLDSWAAISVIIHCIKSNIKPCFIDINLDLGEQLSNISHLSITPTLLQLIAMKVEDKSITNIKKVVLGGEYSTQNTINLCKSLFPNAIITHIYSSTETGDIATCSDMTEGFPKDKFKEYEFDEHNCLIKDKINTNDMWRLEDNRYIFKGRIDRCIKVAGNLISLDILENRINKIDSIKNCVCVETNAPIIGKSYKLHYIGRDSKEDVEQKLRQILQKYEMPVIIKKINKISFGKNYKKVR